MNTDQITQIEQITRWRPVTAFSCVSMKIYTSMHDTRVCLSVDCRNSGVGVIHVLDNPAKHFDTSVSCLRLSSPGDKLYGTINSPSLQVRIRAHFDFSRNSPLLAVPNVTAHPSTASVPTLYHSMWQYNCLNIIASVL